MNNTYNFNKFMKKCHCKNTEQININEKINFSCDNISINKTERYSQYIKFHCYKKNIKNPYAYLENRGLIYKPYISVIQKSNIKIEPITITPSTKYDLQKLDKIKIQIFTSSIN